ncbi:hypothetical protein V5O48_008914 [Marasmius crinis-equi]|uniref:RBR-type E3 ubiquitin transferase n=1 Tax=Marasmius crinis-equi TaxID=585013 RepID=A0ABR3FCU7_9AGAR
MDTDDLTLLLIAQLQLQDVGAVTQSRKGKARSDVPLTDEEYAFQLQAEFMNGFLTTMHDRRIAEGLSNAIETDIGLIETMSTAERAAEDDHRYATALSHGQPLPAQSAVQRLVETSAEPLHVGRQSQRNPLRTRNTVNTGPKVAESSAAGGSSTTETCVICTDRVSSRRAFHAQSCGHYYCRGCLVDLVQACTRDESLYPLRCCRQNLTLSDALPFLDIGVRAAFQTKAREYDVEPNNRLYCTNPICSAFLGSSAGIKRNVACTACRTSICTGCKKLPHAGECTENEALLELRNLAREQGWQTCPGCNRIIELHHGCYHMTCRCGTQFCYLCAVPWKNCQCPQWEEARLLQTAQLRVQHEMGPRIDFNAVAVQRQVQQRVQELQAYHDCDPHRWRHRPGGGQCEECGHYLRDFLKRMFNAGMCEVHEEPPSMIARYMMNQDDSRLIAQLQLEDAEEYAARRRRKGKDREGAHPTDSVYAFQLQADYIKDYIQQMENQRAAHSFVELSPIAESSSAGSSGNAPPISRPSGTTHDKTWAPRSRSSSQPPFTSSSSTYWKSSSKPISAGSGPFQYGYGYQSSSPMSNTLRMASSPPHSYAQQLAAKEESRCSKCHEPSKPAYEAKCGHFYCMNCIIYMVRKACNIPEYQLRCCGKRMSRSRVLRLLEGDKMLRDRYEEKLSMEMLIKERSK